VNEVGSRERAQPAPSRIVWGSLTNPRAPGARLWLDLRQDETEPKIIEAVEATLVVWTSLWPSRPDDVIRFDLRPSGEGTALRWTLSTPGEVPDAHEANRLRHRMNFLINAQLRFSYGN
jgi:hypothetical protein